MSDVPDAQRWNHNIRYQRELFDLIPSHARTALDVGCGEGFGARELARRELEVTGIDTDAASIERAREQDSDGITYVHGDAFTATLPHPTYDVVTAIAVLHHLDLRDGLTKLSQLVSPGGVLLIVGLAQSALPRDLPREALAAVANMVDRARRGSWEHGSPTVWPPPHSYTEVRDVSADVLPGRIYARKLLWRYTIQWTATTPDTAASRKD